MAIDVDRVRAETPGCEEVLHFNNAGAGLMPASVLDAVVDHLRLEARIGGYEAAAARAANFDNTYRALARFLNCRADEIALMENATVAWQAAFYGLAGEFRPGDRILTAEAEYASNYLAFLQIAERTGVEIDVVPGTGTGELDVAALETMIDGRVKLVAVTHIPTNGGLVNPAAAIGKVTRAAGVPYLLDACQAVGQVPVDVEAIGCDMLSATGRKYLRGPRGTGFLYVRRDFLPRVEPPMIDLHGATWTAADGYTLREDARKFENWEYNVAGQIGLGVAVDYAHALGQAAVHARIVELSRALRTGLAQVRGVSVHDIGAEQGGIVSFSAAGADAEALKLGLREQRINCSTSTLSSTRLDMARRGLDRINRASVHYYNTHAEVERFCAAVAALS